MSDRAPDQTTFTITLQPEKNCPDPAQALRRLLKLALRRCSLKCIEVREGER